MQSASAPPLPTSYAQYSAATAYQAGPSNIPPPVHVYVQAPAAGPATPPAPPPPAYGASGCNYHPAPPPFYPYGPPAPPLQQPMYAPYSPYGPPPPMYYPPAPAYYPPPPPQQQVVIVEQGYASRGYDPLTAGVVGFGGGLLMGEMIESAMRPDPYWW